MSALLNSKEKLHGKVYQAKKVIGSGVPFLSQGRFFAVTCYHVLFDANTAKRNFTLDDISFKVQGYEFCAISIISDYESSKASDVLILELKCEGTPSIIDGLTLSTSVDVDLLSTLNPEIVTSHPHEKIISKVPLSSEIRASGDYDIESTVTKGSFYNQNNGSGGAVEYKGVSGSGVFLPVENRIVLFGLLAKLPTSSIEEQVVIKRLDSVQPHIPEAISFSEVIAPASELRPIAPVKDVCFVGYTQRSRDYYCQRDCDKGFSNNINDQMNTWIHGNSGTGKTALVTRNLKELKINHIACNLHPVSISSCDSILQGIIDDITLHVDCEDVPKDLEVRSICQFLQRCDLEDNTVISIDEMSCTDTAIIKEFCEKAMRLVGYYQQLEPEKNIIFVISSIFDPKIHGYHRGKLLESFELVCSNDWDDDIEKLFDIQNTALGYKICPDGRNIILSGSSNIPRLLTKLVKTVYREKDFSSESIARITKCVISEYREHE